MTNELAIESWLRRERSIMGTFMGWIRSVVLVKFIISCYERERSLISNVEMPITGVVK